VRAGAENRYALKTGFPPKAKISGGTMSLPVHFSTLHGGNQPLSLFDRQFAAVGGLTTIPCSASTADGNAIMLTPRDDTPTIHRYTDLAPSFIFVATATNTGPVTINVAGVQYQHHHRDDDDDWDGRFDPQHHGPGGQPPGSGWPRPPVLVPLGARPAFKDNGFSPLLSGDIQQGGVYLCTFVQSFSSGNGGFVVTTFSDVQGLTTWLTWTPTVRAFTGALGSATATGVYRHIGDNIEYTVTIQVVANGTGAGYLIFSLPIAPNAQFAATGISAAGKSVVGLITNDPGTPPLPVTRLFAYDGSYPAIDGSVFIVNGWYFVAP